MLKMSDIANRAGVSPTTVSFVLNDRPEASRIREKTRLKVLQAAEELGYRSNHWASAVRTGNTKMLGFLGGNTEEEHVGRMLQGALEAADAQGYTLKLLRLDSFDDSARQVIRRSSELRLMGMLALHLPQDTLEELHSEARESGTPLVLMDARSASRDITQVVSDDEGGIAAGIEHLVQLGHSKIAMICDQSKTPISLSTTRKEAFLAAMSRHNLPVLPDYVQDGAFRLREPSARAAHFLLTLPPERRPTAIFCSGDLMALATLQMASELGIRVPQELSIVGFANMTFTEFAQLTTIEQPFMQMGRTAVETLLGIIRDKNHEENDKTSTPHLAEEDSKIKVLPTRLIQRASTAPPP